MPVDFLRSPSSRRRIAVAASAFSAACAGATRPPQTAPLPDGSTSRRETVILTGDIPYEYRPRPDTYVAADVNATVDQAWAALPGAFTDVGLEMEGLNTDAKRITSSSVRLRGRLGKVTLDTYLDCGRGPLGSDPALTYVVTMQVTSEVDRVSDTRSEVRSVVSATAKPNATSGDPARCESRGKLERRIAEAAQRRLTTK